MRGSASDRLRVAKLVGDACERIGFLAIVGHGVPRPVIDGAWAQTAAFFDLPQEYKDGFLMTKDYPYGYSGIGKETLARGKAKETGQAAQPAKPDLKESFSIGPYNPVSGAPPQQWPTNPPAMRQCWTAYYKEMEKLASRMLGLFALSLDLPENWFEDKIDRHRSAMRALNYPELRHALEAGQERASAHTDYGTLTILCQDSAGGLQVKCKDGSWQDVKPVADGFVINIGDLMARWTNDKWVSTLHRVVQPPGSTNFSPRRQSIAWFHNINADHVVKCIDTCHGPSNPPKYPPIAAFEHLMQKHLASTKY